MYPKHRATVTAVDLARREIEVTPGRGGRQTEILKLRWRSGWGHTGCRGFDFPTGTVVKMYQRPQDAHPRFRRRGS